MRTKNINKPEIKGIGRTLKEVCLFVKINDKEIEKRMREPARRWT
jgi:hypothetical protein